MSAIWTTFTVYAEPVPYARRASMQGRASYLTPAARNAENLIRMEAARVMSQPITGAVDMRVSFYFPRPKRMMSTKRKPRPMSDELYVTCKRHDIDNLLKTVLDGLTGVGFMDDGQVVRVSAVKVICPGPGYGDIRPRIEISIREIATTEELQ